MLYKQIYQHSRKSRELSSENRNPLPGKLAIDGMSYTCKQLSDIFNTHFLTPGAPSSPQTSVGNVTSYINHSISNSTLFSPTDEEQILILIASLKNSTASGEDGIEAEPIKTISRIIAVPLTLICNVYFERLLSQPNRSTASLCYTYVWCTKRPQLL